MGGGEMAVFGYFKDRRGIHIDRHQEEASGRGGVPQSILPQSRLPILKHRLYH